MPILIQPQRLGSKIRRFIIKIFVKIELTIFPLRVFYLLAYFLIVIGFLHIAVSRNIGSRIQLQKVLSPMKTGLKSIFGFRARVDDDVEIFREREETKGIKNITELNDLHKRRNKIAKRIRRFNVGIIRTNTRKKEWRELEEEVKSLRIDRNDLRKSLQRSLLADRETVIEYIRKNDHFNFKPQLNFSKTRNPCFEDRSQRKSIRRCLPYFYVAGFPKSATTDVWYRLSRHPQIAISHPKVKDLHWWTAARLIKPMKDLTSYTKYFKNVTTSNNLIVGDACPSTAWRLEPISTFSTTEPVTYSLLKALDERRLLPIQLILAYTPNAKFILMLRNPVDRLYSDFRSSQKNATKEGFHRKVIGALRMFFHCLSKSDIRFCTYEETRSRLTIGLYVVFINDILSIVPIENLLIMNLDDYHWKRRESLWKMCAFLGVKCPPETLEPMDFTGKRINRGDTNNWEGMMRKTRKLLETFYEPFNDELARMIGDGFVWNAIA